MPATFFVVGSEVVRHPDVVRRLHREGFELGNHTFTHGDVAALPGWEQRLQIGLTDNALAGTVGIRPRLFRPPYSSVPASANARQARTIEAIARRGYDVVLADLDGEDWRRPGVQEIVASATPQGTRGGIVLLHDGGGDRSQTVRAIERLVPQLRARGFRFVTVSQLAGLSRDQAEVPVGGWDRTRGRILITTLGDLPLDDDDPRLAAGPGRRALRRPRLPAAHVRAPSRQDRPRPRHAKKASRLPSPSSSRPSTRR